MNRRVRTYRSVEESVVSTNLAAGHPRRRSGALLALGMLITSLTGLMVPDPALAATALGGLTPIPTQPSGARPTQAGLHRDPAKAAPKPAAPAKPTPATEGWDTFSHWRRNPNGTITTQFFATPAFRRTATGWAPIDPSVKPRAEVTHPFSAEGTVRPVRFGKTSAGVVEIELDGGPLTMAAPGLNIGPPSATANGVIYADAAKDTDLSYTVTASGVKEKLILRSPLAPRSFTFQLADPKHQLGKPSAQPDGSVVFGNEIDRHVRLVLSPAVAYQGTGAPSDPVTNDPSSAHLSISQVKNGYTVSIAVDERWVATKHYPIVLDPSVTFSSTQMTLGTDYDNTSLLGSRVYQYSGNISLQTGIWGDSNPGYNMSPARSVIVADLSSIPPYSIIQNADFYANLSGCLYNYSSGPSPCSASHPAYAVTLATLADWQSSWTFDHVTAEDTGYVAASVSIPSFSYTYGYDQYGNHICTSGCGQWDWGTSNPSNPSPQFANVVSGWVNNPSTNHGVLMTSETYSGQSGGPVFNLGVQDVWGLGYAGSTPTLTITYLMPPVPTAPSPVSASMTSGQAGVSWGRSSPSSDPNSPITSYEVHTFTTDGTDQGITVNACPTCTSAMVYGLQNGVTYYFGVRAVSRDGYSPYGNSNNVIGPLVPTLQKAVGPPQTVYGAGQGVTYTLGLNNPSSSTVTATITDQLPSSIVVDQTSIFQGPSTCPSDSGQTVTNSITCTVLPGNLLRVNNVSLAPQGSLLITYTASLRGNGQGCSIDTNAARVFNAAGSVISSVPLTVCDTGLGFENWWTYITQAIGPQATASVNVANGNLVVQQTDTTPVQAHGRLSYVLRRTYNSEDTTLVTLPGTIGAGWVLNIGQSGDLAGDGVTATGLYVPPAEDFQNAYGVTLIDRDGTRHVFTPSGVSTSPINVVYGTTPASLGSIGTVVPQVLQTLSGSYNNICVDETFTPPPGVHLGLWRYVGVQTSSNSAGCTPASGTSPVVLGFGAERPDRVRYEFSATGNLLDMQDGSGTDLRYLYQFAPVGGGDLGPLQGVYEPRSCSVTLGTQPYSPSLIPPTCRAFRFAYNQTNTQVTITDPAGRQTVYKLNGPLPSGQLTEVDNPDGTHVSYAYGPNCDNPAANWYAFATSNEMCSASDLQTPPNVTKFQYCGSNGCAYQTAPNQSVACSPPTLGLPRVAVITDRRGTTTNLCFQDTAQTPQVLADRGNERTTYSLVDSSGRVGRIDEGDTSNSTGNVLRTTRMTWDGQVDFETGLTTDCRRPDHLTDNDLCHLVRIGTLGTPNEDTSYTYNSEGGTLTQSQCINGAQSSPTALPPCAAGSASRIDTTWGFHAEYFETGGTVKPFDDAVQGGGSVSSAPGDHLSRSDTGTLFALSDRTQSLTPRGNDPANGPTGSGGNNTYAQYITTYAYDNASTAAPNQVGTGSCSNGSGSTNTGTLCQISAPAFNGSTATITRYTYDAFGQKLSMVTPNEQGTGKSTTYVYYADTDLDLSGQVSAGGWLKAVIDPYSNYVAFAYDHAGNVTRTWDRNATHGIATSAGYNILSSPPSTRYAETLHGLGSTAYSAPWRYVRSSRDPIGNLSTYHPDNNGNVLFSRPPRGNLNNPGDPTSAGPYDTANTYNQNDQVLTTAPPNGQTAYGYDVYGNRTASTDPRLKTTTFTFDSVNRLTATATPRGGSTTGAPCPVVSGEVTCTTSTLYDAVDNVKSTSDGAAITTSYVYDGVHRRVTQYVPRSGTTNEETDTIYDLDGNKLVVCPPLTLGMGNCWSGNVYATSMQYDLLDRLTQTSTHRNGVTNTAGPNAYDGDGNLVSATDASGNVTTYAYDLNDRRTSMSQQHQATVGAAATTATTLWQYDPVGNVTAVIQPQDLNLGDGSGGALAVNGGSASVPSGGSYSSVTLTSGATLKVTGTGALTLSSTGTISICSTCTITVAGEGLGGGNGGTVTSSATAGVGGAPGSSPSNGGGGGGTVGTWAGAGGGGGGHKQAGSAGQGSAGPGGGGAAYGQPDLSDANAGNYAVGSGGGGGGGAGTQTGGKGGAGGGFLQIRAAEVDDNGQVVADGAAGLPGTIDGLGATSSGGGGGGSAGDIWLSARTVVLGPSPFSMKGGPGGAGGASGEAGGQGSDGVVRVDSDTLSGTLPSNAVHRTTDRVTAYSYDYDNRVVDTVQGADSTNATQSGPVDAAGGSNVRTRVVYDADGHVVAQLDPRAFSGWSTASNYSPDTSYMVRADFDYAGRPITQYVPRYDSGAHSDPGLNSAQSSQCPTTATNSSVTPPSVPYVPDYPTTVGLCVTRLTYDGDNNVQQVTLPTSTGSGSSNRFIQNSYTDDNLLLTSQGPNPYVGDSAGNRVTTTYSYDADGRQVMVTSNDNQSVYTTYTLDGLVLSVSNKFQGGSSVNPATQLATSYQYDANGNRTAVTDSNTNQTSYTYWEDNLLKYVTTAANDASNPSHLTGDVRGTTQYFYAANGTLTSVYSPSAIAAQDHYSPSPSFPVETTNTAARPTTYAYGPDNLLLKSVVPVASDGSQLRETDYTYDLGGRKTAQHVFLTNGSGQPISGKDGGTQGFSYLPDDRQNQQSGTDAQTITTGYDPAGNPTSIVESGSGNSIYASYYLDSLPRQVDDGSRNTLYSYDGAGQPNARKFSPDGSSSGATTTYTYSDAELLASMSSTIPQISGGGQAVTTFGYDEQGRLTSESDPNGQTMARSYRPDDMVSTQVLSSGSTSQASWTYQYDNGDRITSQAFSGVAATGGSFNQYTFSYGYDQANRVTSFNNGSTTTTYAYDHDNNRRGNSGAPQGGQPATLFNADDSVMCGATNVSSTSCATALNTYLPFGGLQTTPALPISQQNDTACVDTYQYDGFNRLNQITEALQLQTCQHPATAKSFAYDGLDRQISHNEASTLTGGASTTTVHFDGLGTAIAAETNSSSTDTTYELTAHDQPRAVTQGSNTTYLTDDGQGNISTLISGPTVTCTVRYDPFGVPLVTPGTNTPPCNTGSNTSGNVTNEIFYRGGRRDGATGDYQLGSRTYDPSQDQFLQPDTYRSAQPSANLGLGADPLTRNSYTFLNGMSVNENDPTGHAGSHALTADTGGSGALNAAECLLAIAVSENCASTVEVPWTPQIEAQMRAQLRAEYMQSSQPPQLLQLNAEVQQLEDFLSSLAKLATGCVTSPSGLATCTGALIAPVAPEVGAGLIALGGIPNDVTCVQTHDLGSCAAGVASVVPGTVELAGPLMGAVRGGLDALSGGAGRAADALTGASAEAGSSVASPLSGGGLPPGPVQVPYGSTDLSQQAIAFRQASGLSSARNVAVIEYQGENGLATIVRASERGVGHAERLAAAELMQSVDATAVTRIYSELQPCDLPGGYCSSFIAATFPQAEVTYSFEYGATVESRRFGLTSLQAAVLSLRRP